MKALSYLLLPFILFHAVLCSASPGSLIIDFILPKVLSGAARPWNISFLPETPVNSKPGSKEADFISSLPGQPKSVAVTRQYSGYIPVDDVAGRFFFYYFAEARKNATNGPIIVWINGGPGCSSVGSGAFHEHGPLSVAQGGKALNECLHSWNNFAHTLYVDTPVGTGFSYSNTPSDYQNYNDDVVAADNLCFLVNWLARFPEHAGRKIYLAGEGYAGNYIPQLAQLIHNRNQAGNHPSINLQGLILQNAVIDADEDRWGFFDHLWSHGMLSQTIYENIETKCIKNSTADSCLAATKAAGNILLPFYLYDITASICGGSDNITTPTLPVDQYYECQEKDVAAYLESPEVQKALHVNRAKAPLKWVQCNSDVAKSYGEITISTLPILKSLLSNNISVFIYNGDADSSIPAMSSRLSLRKLGFPKSVKWHGWYPMKIESGGYSEEYNEGPTYATVRGAGHFVAKKKGSQLKYLLDVYLNGTLANATVYTMV